MKVTLNGGRVIEAVPFVNPEEYVWSEARNVFLVGASFGFSIDYAMVLADSFADAIDIFVESDFGKGLRIDRADMDDYVYIHVEGVEMDVTDARRRFPYLDIDAIIDDGWETGETSETCHWTGQGIAYDTDHLHGFGPEQIESIEMELDDFRRFPKVFQDQGETRETIRESFARSAFVLEWADAMEENGTRFFGAELTDVAPEWTPAPYLRWAEKSIRTIEESIGIGIVEALNRACFVPCSRNWERRYDADSSAEDFGHTIGMEFQGHGVSWSDDHPGLPFKLPSGESPFAFLTGEVSLSDFID